MTDRLFRRIKFDLYSTLTLIIEQYNEILNLNHCIDLLQRPIGGGKTQTVATSGFCSLFF